MSIKQTRELLIERIAGGDVPDRDAAIASLSEDERRLLEQITRDNESILRELPPAQVAAEVRRRVQLTTEKRTKLSGFLILAPIAAAAAIAAVVVVVSSTGQVHVGDPAVEMTRVKGEPTLSIFRRSGSGAERLAPGAPVRAQDVLQLRYVPGTASFGAVFSIDGRGSVTQHLPRESERASLAAELDPAGAALPFAYELDDAPRFERFFFVTANERFALDEVLAALQRLASSAAPDSAQLELPRTFTITTTLLRKETP